MHVGLTSGVFDLIHFGHLQYLERCRALCDRLLVGVDSDEMVREAKGPTRPIIPELERLQMVQSLTPVDAAFLLRDLPDLERIVRQFRVTTVFKHEGFKGMANVVGVGDGLATLIIIPDVPGLVSTSTIIDRIRPR
jgi:cytidyltransferase-like protein